MWNVWSWNRWVLCAITMLMYVLYMFLCSVTGVHMCVYVYIYIYFKNTHTVTHAHKHMYMYIYIYVYK